VMGLAPYGEPLYVNQIRKTDRYEFRGQYRLNMKYFGFLAKIVCSRRNCGQVARRAAT